MKPKYTYSTQEIPLVLVCFRWNRHFYIAAALHLPRHSPALPSPLPAHWAAPPPALQKPTRSAASAALGSSQRSLGKMLVELWEMAKNHGLTMVEMPCNLWLITIYNSHLCGFSQKRRKKNRCCSPRCSMVKQLFNHHGFFAFSTATSPWKFPPPGVHSAVIITDARSARRASPMGRRISKTWKGWVDTY